MNNHLPTRRGLSLGVIVLTDECGTYFNCVFLTYLWPCWSLIIEVPSLSTAMTVTRIRAPLLDMSGRQAINLEHEAAQQMLLLEFRFLSFVNSTEDNI